MFENSNINYPQVVAKLRISAHRVPVLKLARDTTIFLTTKVVVGIK